MESFLSGYSKGYTGNVGINYTGGVSGAPTSGGASFNANGQNADISQLKPGDTFQGEVMSVNGEDVQIQLTNGQYLSAKLERDVQVALGQALTLQVQSNKDNKVVLKPVADGNSQMLRVGEAALKAANMSVNEKNLQLVAKLIENGMPINKNTLMTYNRLALQNPKVPLSNIIELNKLKLPITEDNARQLENYRNMEHKIVDGVKDAANELVKTYESIVNGEMKGMAQSNMQNNMFGKSIGSAPNLPALENGAKFMEKVLSLVAGEGTDEGAAIENNANKAGAVIENNANKALITENNANKAEAVIENNANKALITENNANKAEAIIENNANKALITENNASKAEAAAENSENKAPKSENNINIAKNTDSTLNKGLQGDIKAENDANIAKNENNTKIGNNANSENNVNIKSDVNNPKTENNVNTADSANNPKTGNNVNAADNANNTKTGNDVNTADNANNTKTGNNVNTASDASNPNIANNVNTNSHATVSSRAFAKADGNADMNAGVLTRSENAAKAEGGGSAGINAKTENIAKADINAKTENITKAEGSEKALTASDNGADAENVHRNIQKGGFAGSAKTDSGEILTERTRYLPKSATTSADNSRLNDAVNAFKSDVKGGQPLNQAHKLSGMADAKLMQETAGNVETRKSEEIKEIENRLKDETPKNVPERIINYISSGKLDIKSLHRILTDSGIGKSLTPEQKNRIFDSEPFKSLLKDGLGKRWSLSPADIASEGKVEEFYSKLLKESNRLAKLINEAMHPASSAQAAGMTHARAMGNIVENVEFMNQMNQMFNYVQLPLKFGDSQAHGDLYVYTNKKNIARNDGMLTAFLHLDMDNLGPLDVSIALQTDKMQITTKFYISESSIKLVGEHMGELAARLERKGYKCKSMVLEKDEDKTVLEHIEEQVAAGNAVIGYRKFDTRA